MVAMFSDSKLAPFMKKLLPRTKQLYVVGVERVSYSIGKYGFPERNDTFNAAFLSMVEKVKGDYSTEVLLRGGQLSKDGRGYTRDTKVVELRSAALALLEGDLDKPDEAQEDAPPTEQDKLKHRQIKLLEDIDTQGTLRFETLADRITQKKEVLRPSIS
ncbi:hypothetical protein [Corallococcus exiguus]|uniref:hypothetical protein n=1 Tax=Corallococcus exiguus TaxID=83462 RepID=UPI003DA2B8D8